MDHLLIDLASHDLGGRALEASDESLGPKERILDPGAPRPPDPSGGPRDGWETRRRRDGGHDWVIVRLGVRGILRRVVVDTTWFEGDEPDACSVEAIDLPGKPNIVELVRDRHRWFEALPRVPIDGGGRNEFNLPTDLPATHLRLVLYPDGGVARLRAYGEPAPGDGPCASDRVADLAAVTAGGRVIDCSTIGGSSPNGMLGEPGGAAGWLTPRRRQSGHEWAVIRLAGPATLERIEIDTSGFRGKAPEACAVEGLLANHSPPEALRSAAWLPLIGPSEVDEDGTTRWSDLASEGPFSHLRLSVLPDGGIRSFRVLGRCRQAWHEGR